MASKSKNPIRAFLASVKLALLLIALLASTSIIGTVVEQNKANEHYIQQWGENAAKVIQLFNFDDMYSSVWFLSLLGAFSLNLIVCSLDRIPAVVKIVRKDNLAADPNRLAKMKLHKEVKLAGTLASSATEELKQYLARKGWKVDSRARQDEQDGTLFFSQKGAWTRYGVYVVHLSILLILLGSVIGSPTVADKILNNREFAFKGAMSLPESAQRDFIVSYTDDKEIPLDFTVRCNYFDIHYYPGLGMPKDYLSSLTVIEDGQEILTKTIEVNKPLTYKGVTFYQSSYNKANIITLREISSGNIYTFFIDPGNYSLTHKWREEGTDAMLRIQDARLVQTPDGRTGIAFKIWMVDSDGPPSIFTLLSGAPVIIERPKAKYELTINTSHIIKLRETTGGNVHAFPFDSQDYSVTHQWQEGKSDAMLRIQDARPIYGPDEKVIGTEMKIWMMDSDGPPSMFSLKYGSSVIVERPKAKYELSIGPHFATGLQVAKDPGVWWVYTGCILMIIGLYMAFFMSHRKIWAHVFARDGQAVVLFAGHANKNSFGFAKTFSSLTEDFAQRT